MRARMGTSPRAEEEAPAVTTALPHPRRPPLRLRRRGPERSARALHPIGRAGAPSLIELRHDIHRHPEISGKEERTAGLVAERLRKLGFKVTTGVGGHGVIGSCAAASRAGGRLSRRHGRGAVRRSRPGRVQVGHAGRPPHLRPRRAHDDRGRDAQGFASIKDRLPGTVMLIFQPAEENATGAKAMLADGAFEP